MSATARYRRLDAQRFVRHDPRTGVYEIVYVEEVPPAVLDAERRGVQLSQTAAGPVPRGPRRPGTYRRL